MKDNSDKYRFSPWYMRTAFESDYGSFTCEKCGCGFHHSPSEITRNDKIVYACCCGYCTNEIIRNNWDYYPYE